MKKTGKKKKRQVKKILTVLVVILGVGIVGVVGVGIWKNRGISKEEQVASTAKEKELKKTSSSRTITYEGKEYCYK